LELVARYLRLSHFNPLMRQACAERRLGGDFGVVAMLRLLIAFVVLRGRRLRHLAYLADDVALQRFAGLRVVPTARTVRRWLQSFSMKTVTTLQTLNAAVIGRVVPRQALRTLTVDVDGTVIWTGLRVERARRGFSPHHRKVPSYYPIVAQLPVLEAELTTRRLDFEEERAIFVTVVRRLMPPGNHRAAERWKQDYALTGTEALWLYQLYRAMPWLGSPRGESLVRRVAHVVRDLQEFHETTIMIDERVYVVRSEAKRRRGKVLQPAGSPCPGRSDRSMTRRPHPTRRGACHFVTSAAVNVCECRISFLKVFKMGQGRRHFCGRPSCRFPIRRHPWREPRRIHPTNDRTLLSRHAFLTMVLDPSAFRLISRRQAQCRNQGNGHQWQSIVVN
jgi:hypothetical protein